MPPFKKKPSAPAPRHRRPATAAPSPYAEPSGPPAFPLPPPLRRQLDGLRARQLAVAWAEGAALLLATGIALASLQMLCDWWLDLPRPVRAVFLLGDLVVLGWILRGRLVSPWKARLTPATAALRAEKCFPRLRGSLISAVQLSQGDAGARPVSPKLLAALVTHAAGEAGPLDFRKIVPAARAVRIALAGAVFLALAVGIGVLDARRSTVLLRRVALSNEPLPTRTIVVPVTRDLPAPVGGDVELAAKASGELPRAGRVQVVYEGGRRQDFPVASAPGQADTFKLVLPGVRLALTYRFYLGDGHGPVFNVRPIATPAVSSLDAEEIFPAYTGLGKLKRTPANLTLLAGSRLRLRLSSTLPLKSAVIQPQGAGAPVAMKLDAGLRGASAELPIPAKDLTGFSIALVSSEGAPSTADTLYRVEITQDKPPAVRLLLPASERETVTLGAAPAVEFEAVDDFALTRLTFCHQAAPPAAAEAADAARETVRLPFPIDGSPGRQRRAYTWTLSALTPRPPEGTVITYWIEAADNNTATGPGLTETRRQQFVVVSPAAKREEIQRRIGESSHALKELSDAQRKLGEEVDALLPGTAKPRDP